VNKSGKSRCCSNCQYLEIFEVINFIMILGTFVSIGLKFAYDSAFEEQNFNERAETEYLDFDNMYSDITISLGLPEFSLGKVTFSLSILGYMYIFQEVIFIFDATIIFLMAMSITKYTYFWIPSLKLIIFSITFYVNESLSKIFFYVLLFSGAFSTILTEGLYAAQKLILRSCLYMAGSIAYGFNNFFFVLMRNLNITLQGTRFNMNTVFLV